MARKFLLRLMELEAGSAFVNASFVLDDIRQIKDADEICKMKEASRLNDMAVERLIHGRIKDTFTPVIEGKMAEFDTEIIDHVTWNDDDTKVTASILDMIKKRRGYRSLYRRHECGPG